MALTQGRWSNVQVSNEEHQPKGPAPLYMMYHLNSDQCANACPADAVIDDEVGRRMYDHEMAEIQEYYDGLDPVLDFSALEVVELPADPGLSSAAFAEVVRERRSLRTPRPYRMSIQELAAVIQCSLGITGRETSNGREQALRAVPSAGALYPLVAFFIPLSVEGLSPDLYHYRPESHSLGRMGRALTREEISRFLIDSPVPLGSSVLVVLAALFNRTACKYGERSYRYILAEAGAILEHMALAAEAVDLRAVMLGGYLDSLSNDWIGVNGIDAGTVMCAAIGKEDAPGPRARPAPRAAQP